MLEEVVKAIDGAKTRLDALSRPLDMEGRTQEIGALEAGASDPNFWDDPAGAQVQMQRLNTLKESLVPWHAVRKRLDDVQTLAELAALEESPEEYVPEIEAELEGITAALDTLTTLSFRPVSERTFLPEASAPWAALFSSAEVSPREEASCQARLTWPWICVSPITRLSRPAATRYRCWAASTP